MTFDVEWLRQIVEQDEFGLLVAPVKQAPPTADERLVSSFKEICAFIEKHGHQPANTPADVNEFQLFHRLQGFLNDRNSWESLAPHDVYGLLAETVPESLDEIVATESFGILDGSSEAVEIFTLRHVPAEKTVPDQIADFALGKEALLIIEEGAPDYIEQDIASSLRRRVLNYRIH